MTQSLAEFRKDKDEAFRNEGWSPLTDEQKANFRGLSYYSENPKLIFQNVVIDPVDAGQTVEIPTSAGDTEQYLRAGIIKFSLEGKEYQLHLYKQSFSTNKDLNGSEYFLPIKEVTSGSDTYKDGRYVDIEVENGKIPKLDFNYAYNPYCAYNHNWHCPITPEENRLPIKIEAGEKNFNGQ